MTGVGNPLWSPEELASVTGGEWLRSPGAAWAPVNVRTTAMGSMLPDWLPASIIFVTDAKRLQQAFEHEARPAREPRGCVVVGRGEARSKYLPRHRAVLVVRDTTAALRALAARARERMQGRVILVTGTIGKTTTRAMLAHVLGKHGTVLVNRYNGEAQVLQNMASASPRLGFAVFEAEVGLGSVREAFRETTAAVRPDVVLVTHFDAAHVGPVGWQRFSLRDTLSGFAAEKLELGENLADGGTVVLNRDSPDYAKLLRAVGERRVITFGGDGRTGHRLDGIENEPAGMRVRANAAGTPLDYRLPLRGRFMAVNSLGVLAAAAQVGVDAATAAKALATFPPVPGRARFLRPTIRGTQFTVIDDSYNANPHTMRATLDLLAETEPGPGGRRIAVLGDIAHLGLRSAEAHASLAAEARARGIDRVYTFGDQARHLHDALPPAMAAGHFDDRDLLASAVLADVRDGDVVAFKASIPARFEIVVREIMALAGMAPTQPSPEPVPLISAGAAAGLTSRPLTVQRRPDIPRLAWLYASDDLGGASLIAGEDVEELPTGIVEGAWDGPYEEGRPDLAEHLFGSGLMRTPDGDLVVLTPKHTLEGVFVLEHKPTGRSFVSPSLALICAAADLRLRNHMVKASMKVGSGFYKYDSRLVDTDEITLHKLVYYNYALRPDGSAVRLGLPEAREFATYAEYRQGVSEVVAALAANAAHPARRRTYEPLTTVSAGYDSAACAVLAREVGCDRAVTIRTARRGMVDTGRPVAEALGLPVIERERPDFPEVGERTPLSVAGPHMELAAEFLSSAMGGDDVLFVPFEDVLPGTMLFTGFHGDKYWDVIFKASTDAKRGDVSGSSLGEYRARLGFLNLPVPYIFIRSQPSVRTIGRSQEMKPWSIAGAYNRPVPRRMAEEAGVHRKHFGQKKMAGCIIFNGVDEPTRVALNIMTERYAQTLNAVSVS